MIVIDVGCARWGNDYSVERLLEMFRPDLLIGFDPASKVGEAMPSTIGRAMPDGTGPEQTDPNWIYRGIELRREAAWTYDGQIGFREDGLISHVTDDPEAPKVRCVDLARVIDELPAGPVVLKLDCEGAEFDLLEHLIERNVDARLDRLLVEWHPIGQGKRRHAIEMALTCPVEQWRW